MSELESESKAKRGIKARKTSRFPVTRKAENARLLAERKVVMGMEKAEEEVQKWKAYAALWVKRALAAECAMHVVSAVYDDK